MTRKTSWILFALAIVLGFISAFINPLSYNKAFANSEETSVHIYTVDDEGELEIEDQEEIHTPEKPQEPQALSQPQVPSQPQAPSQPVRVSHPTSDNPKTGDSSLMVSLAVLSIAITGFVISKKKVNI